METIEDVEDAKDVEEARQEPSERVTIETYIDTREPGACESEIVLLDRVDGSVRFACEIIGDHSVHMARGEFPNDEGKNLRWKLIWEVQG